MGKSSIGLAASLFSSLIAATAMAQQSPGVTILDVARGAPRGDRAVTEINSADCLANDSVRMALELKGYENFELEVWAGDGCDTRTNRTPSATATCWLVHSEQPRDALTTLELGVRDFLRGRTRAEDDATDAGASMGDPACESSSPVIAPQILTAYVMLVDANADVAAAANWKATYRLRGSPPPTLLSVESGDRRLAATFSLDATDQFFSGVQLFCDPAPDDPNAASTAQVMTDDAGALVPTCSPSAELVPGAPATTLQHLRCGSAPKGAPTAVADGLLNGVSYNIAAASVDTYGNVGPLSGVACQVPQAQEKASNVDAQACSFTGTSRDRRESHGAALTCVIALGAAAWRRRWAGRNGVLT
ncbi:MAG TPA: hypothetical protein VER11_01575 [Polyangiaceae bacterium]|nr:hypothetical protein [Polyangiaceae bacterium]